MQGLLLTSLGAHPTKVWLGAHSRTQAVLVQKGKQNCTLAKHVFGG